MQSKKWLKDSKNPFSAITISLTLHICIFMIMISFTSIPNVIALKDEEIIHVSLASMKSGEKPHTRSLQKSEETNARNEDSVVKHAETVEAIEKQDKTKSASEAITHHIADTRSASTAIAMPSRLSVTEIKNTKPIQPDYKVQQASFSAGNSSIGDISMAVPRYRENTPPVYPSTARIRGYEGVVLLAAEIFTDGRVGSLKIKKSSGYKVLDVSALEAVKKWRFEPGKKSGKPVNMWVEVPVKFVLENNNTT